MPQYGLLVPGRSLGLGPGSSIDQGSHLLLIEHITASEVSSSTVATGAQELREPLRTSLDLPTQIRFDRLEHRVEVVLEAVAKSPCPPSQDRQE